MIIFYIASHRNIYRQLNFRYDEIQKFSLFLLYVHSLCIVSVSSCDNEINDSVPNSNIIYKLFSLNLPKMCKRQLKYRPRLYIIMTQQRRHVIFSTCARIFPTTEKLNKPQISRTFLERCLNPLASNPSLPTPQRRRIIYIRTKRWSMPRIFTRDGGGFSMRVRKEGWQIYFSGEHLSNVIPRCFHGESETRYDPTSDGRGLEIN